MLGGHQLGTGIILISLGRSFVGNVEERKSSLVKFIGLVHIKHEILRFAMNSGYSGYFCNAFKMWQKLNDILHHYVLLKHAKASPRSLHEYQSHISPQSYDHALSSLRHVVQ